MIAQPAWAVGTATGSTPHRLTVSATPLLRGSDLSGVSADFVADPFLVDHEGAEYLFFEYFDRDLQRGALGVAAIEAGRPRFLGPVVPRPHHLSYPHVFRHDGRWWMTPETLESGAVELFVATDFPMRWERVERLVEGRWADPTPFSFDGRWWMFACGRPYQHDVLQLFVADELVGPWRPHPRSPVRSGDRRRSRPAGRVVIHEGRPVRFAQDCQGGYGLGVRAFRIDRITPDAYEETELGPVLVPSPGWRATRTHHVDLRRRDGRWVGVVDGAPD